MTTTVVEYDAITQDYFVTIPDEILQKLTWEEGDSIEFEVTDNKQIILSKVEDSTSEDRFKNTPEEYAKDFDNYYEEYLQNLNKDTFYEDY